MVSPSKKPSFFNTTATDESGDRPSSRTDSQAVPDSLSEAVDNKTEHFFFRRALLVIAAVFAVMLFSFAAVFFLAVRGDEKTLVPDILGRDLVEGLILLQEKELYPRLQAKYTSDPLDKGKIISQKPQAGLYVKAGKRIIITVSRGAIVDTVEDYVGQNITEARARLVALFSTYKPLLVIKEPVTYVYDPSPSDTILAQDPAPGTPLTQLTELAVVVSRGPENVDVLLPDFKGLKAKDAIAVLSRFPHPFVFRELPDDVSGEEPIVRSQSPSSDERIQTDQKLVLNVSRPALFPEGRSYGMFTAALPDYPIAVELELWIRDPGQEDRLMFAMPHPGGELSFPYMAEEGTIYILKADGEELIRHEVKAENSEN